MKNFLKRMVHIAAMAKLHGCDYPDPEACRYYTGCICANTDIPCSYRAKPQSKQKGEPKL